MIRAISLFPAVILVLALLAAPASTAERPTGPDTIAVTASDSLDDLLAEVSRMIGELRQLRKELAAARLEAAEARREAADLRQFITDHREYGDDFEQYQAFKAIAEREARQREAQRTRERLEQQRAEQRQRREQARAEREAEQAEQRRLDRYAERGFAPVGLDVFGGRMAFSYQTVESNPVRVDWDINLGRFLRPLPPHRQIDFSQMTISGSILNAADQTRNIGVAIVFFDERGNQVGSETIQVNNARPDVPYPFTSTIEMALNRPFASSSTYVLYADPVLTTDG
jgi:hypothetical protein